MSNTEVERFSLRPVLLGIALTTMSTIPVFLTGALGVQIRGNLRINASELGLAVAVFFACAALTSIASGKLAERSGFTIIMRLCAMLSVVALLGLGFLSQSYEALLIFLGLGGIVNGAVQPAVNLFLANVVPTKRQGLAFGIKQAAIPVATFLSGLAVPTIALTIGWRYAYLCIAPLGVVLFFLVPHRNVEKVKSRHRKLQSPAKVYIAPLIVLAIGMGLGSSAANALSAFIVSSSVHAGWKPGAAGLLVVLGSVTGISARLVNGYLADKRNGRHLLVVSWMVGIGGIGYLFMVIGYSWLIIPATIISYGAGWGWNGLFNFAVVWNYPKSAGYATGITQSGAYVGSVIGPILFGFIVDRSGYSLAWSTTAIEALAAALAIIAARHLILKSPEYFANQRL